MQTLNFSASHRNTLIALGALFMLSACASPRMGVSEFLTSPDIQINQPRQSEIALDVQKANCEEMSSR